MTEIKGKFITLASSLMEVYKDAAVGPDKKLYEATGLHANELDPESWYDIEHFKNFVFAYVEASPAGEEAMVTFGKQIYPTIKKTAGLPHGLKFPLDYVEFELRGYLENVRGPNVKPRKLISVERNKIVLQTEMIEQSCKMLEGVYLGLLQLGGAPNGKVKQTKCMNRGDEVCEFEITW